jgi:hypothetical protein
MIFAHQHKNVHSLSVARVLRGALENRWDSFMDRLWSFCGIQTPFRHCEAASQSDKEKSLPR